MSTTGMTKQQAHKAFAVVHKYAMTWTGHKTFCKRLVSESLGSVQLPDCTCGYFEATEELDRELSRIRKGEDKPKHNRSGSGRDHAARGMESAEPQLPEQESR